MLKFNTHWPDIRIGDVYFVIGDNAPPKNDWSGIEAALWYRSLPKRFPSMPPCINLFHVYNEHCYQNGAEPSWVEQLPNGAHRELRRGWLTGEYFEPLAILLGYSQMLGFTCAIQDGGLIHETCIALDVFRLQYIRQLGFLHDPVINEAPAHRGMVIRFGHTRYMHSLMVMSIASLIGRQVGLSEYDLRHLQIAALTHDVLTPAGGDSIKPIDFKAFDEDIHYPEIFRNNPEWEAVRDRFGLDEGLLSATVLGEGVLGHILDIADKTAYTAHDVEEYLMGDHDPRTFRSIIAPESVLSIFDLKQSLGSGSCGLWDKVALIDGRIVITDAEKLVGFLKLRALMFRHLYYNPLARYREQMLAFLILEPLYHTGTITREMLLRMNDSGLDDYLSKLTGHYDLRMEISHTEVSPVIEMFATEEEARERIQSLYQEDSGLLFMLEVIPRVSEKALRYLVLDTDDVVRPLSEACPGEAEAIRAIDSDPLPAKLYILSPEKMEGLLPHDLQERLCARQRERFNLE